MRAQVVVVGSGIFGCWAALYLREAGLDVLLIDAWGVAHPRATSGGETRIIRTAYGDRSLYTEWAWRSLQEWRKREQEWKVHLFVPCGVLWMGRKQEGQVALSRRVLQAQGIPFRDLTPEQLVEEFPLFSSSQVDDSILENESGVLLARRACRRVADSFSEAGGRRQIGVVERPLGNPRRLTCLRLAGGETVEAESILFSAGPWLPGLFPDLLANQLQVTRQEVFFFGVPAGQETYNPERLPAWIDFANGDFYGIPATQGRGLKVACDTSGPPFDPTHGDRSPDPEELRKVRDYLDFRMPSMKDAPLVDSRVCQYERTVDRHLIIDRHPAWSNVILAGGGSGHGFKLAPAVGRLAADLILNADAKAPSEVQLTRFS